MLRCKTSFYDIPSGYVFPAGALVDAASPVVARHPHLFTGSTVEQATAAPGEVRNVAKKAPAKKAAAKKAQG